VGLLASVRASASVAPELLGLFDRSEKISLGPLSLGELQSLLETRLGRSFPHPALTKIYEISGGNPYFALELAHALVGQDSERLAETLPLPQNLVDLVRRRLSGLTSRTRTALLAASALAHPTPSLLAAALRLKSGRLCALDEAVERGIVTRDDDVVRFTHPLLPSVIYDDAGANERRRVHRRLAAVVTDPEERAAHLALATDHADSPTAKVLEEAAQRACSRGALVEAASLADHAWRLTPDEQGSERLRRMSEAGRLHYTTGDVVRARSVLDEVVSSAGASPERARALLLRAQVEQRANLGQALMLEKRAAAEAGDDDLLLAYIERAMFANALVRLDPEEAAGHARAAVEHAQKLDNPAQLAASLINLAAADFLAGRGISWDTVERALALERECGELPTGALPSFWLGWMLHLAGDLNRARPLYTAMIERAQGRGEEPILPVLLAYLSEVELFAGAYETAARLGVEADEVARQLGLESARISALTRLALVDAHVGRLETARARAEQTKALADRLGSVHAIGASAWITGFVELSLGNLAAVREHLGPVMTRLIEAGVAEPLHTLAPLPDLVEALVGLGDVAAADRLVRELERRGRALDRPWALATAGRCMALLQAAGGDLEGAIAAADAALVEHGRLPMPFELGRTLLVKGTIERRARRNRAARASLQQALALFERLGTPLWAERARVELSRIGGRAPRPGTLTPTERRVAELVAAGRSNHEVARTLFLSPKTVEWNLTKIYRKLHVQSRSELTAKLTRRAVSAS
jgi:DNA-binding CsgD family transcriptional regulator